MSETKTIKVRACDGAIKECPIGLPVAPPYKLVFSGVDLGTQEFSGEDYFEALVQLRQELEKIGCQLLCSGSRPDVFPSGMSRSMSGGRKAYITRLGSPALKTDLVDIFDYTGPEKVGSVAQQKAFHEKWAESLRKK